MLFWISNLLWDVLIYLISITAMYILILSADDNRTFNTYGAPGSFGRISGYSVVRGKKVLGFFVDFN